MKDRAKVVAITIIAIITEALKSWLRSAPSDLRAVQREVEAYLRTEFADCAREARRELVELERPEN